MGPGGPRVGGERQPWVQGPRGWGRSHGSRGVQGMCQKQQRTKGPELRRQGARGPGDRASDARCFSSPCSHPAQVIILQFATVRIRPFEGFAP